MCDKKRSAVPSTLKMKLKKIDKFADEDICGNETCETTAKSINELPVTQPIFKKKLRRKLHTLLANWKPSLKTFSCENQDIILQTKSQNWNQIEEKAVESVAEITCQNNLQQISCANSENMSLQDELGEVKDDSNCLIAISNANENTNEYIMNAGDVIVLNESSVHNTSDCNNNCTFVSKDTYSENCILEQDRTDLELNPTTLEQENLEISALSPKTCHLLLPDTATELPQTSENEKYEGLTSDRTHNIQKTKDSEQNVIHKQQTEVANDLNGLCNQIKFLENDEKIINYSHNDVKCQCDDDAEIEEKKEIEAGTKDPDTKFVTFDDALDDLNISHSQLNYIENNIIPTEKEKAIPSTNHSQFIPFSSTSFSPTIPQINWVRQVQEDRKRLQAVVREISQLNAMLTRSIREIWPVKKPS